MEYTATGFAAPIRFFFRALVMSKKQLVAEPVSAENIWIAAKHLEWSTDSFWEAWFYRPVARFVLWASGLVRRLQNGIIQVYLLLLVIALITIMFLAV